MRRKVNGFILLDEGADAVEGVASGGHIFKHDWQFIFQKCLVGVGHVAMNQVGNIAVFRDDDWIAFSVTGREDIINAVGDFLASFEIFICAVSKIGADDVIAGQFHIVSLDARDINFSVREMAQFRFSLR